jgi:hypothetical protein
VVLEPLTDEDVGVLLDRAASDPSGLDARGSRWRRRTRTIALAQGAPALGLLEVGHLALAVPERRIRRGAWKRRRNIAPPPRRGEEPNVVPRS